MDNFSIFPGIVGVAFGVASELRRCLADQSNSCECEFSAIKKPGVGARIVVEMGSHIPKGFLFNDTTLFSTSTKGMEKSLRDFTGNHFCENPVF